MEVTNKQNKEEFVSKFNVREGSNIKGKNNIFCFENWNCVRSRRKAVSSIFLNLPINIVMLIGTDCLNLPALFLRFFSKQKSSQVFFFNSCFFSTLVFFKCFLSDESEPDLLRGHLMGLPQSKPEGDDFDSFWRFFEIFLLLKNEPLAVPGWRSEGRGD